MSAVDQSYLPSCPYGHTTNFEKSEGFFIKKCRRPQLMNPPCPQNDRTMNKPPSPFSADVVYGRPLYYMDAKTVYGQFFTVLQIALVNIQLFR